MGPVSKIYGMWKNLKPKLEPLSKICLTFHALFLKQRWWPKMLKSVIKHNSSNRKTLSNAPNVTPIWNEIFKRWVEFFNELLNGESYQEDDNTCVLNNNEPQGIIELPPSIDEVEDTIKKLKNNKASVTDHTQAELFKSAGPEFTKLYHLLILMI